MPERAEHQAEHSLPARGASGTGYYIFFIIKFIIKINFILLILSRCGDSGRIPEPPSYAVIGREVTEGMHVYKNAEEPLNDYRRAAELIRSGRVNKARFLIGRIELSNVNFEFKERAGLLRLSVRKIPWDSFNDPVSWREYADHPFHYRDAQVEWDGRITHGKEGGFVFTPDGAAGNAALFVLAESEEFRKSGGVLAPGSFRIRGFLRGSTGEILEVFQIL